jgi:hypothetical protein
LFDAVMHHRALPKGIIFIFFIASKLKDILTTHTSVYIVINLHIFPHIILGIEADAEFENSVPRYEEVAATGDPSVKKPAARGGKTFRWMKT